MRGSSSFCLTFSRSASNSALDPWMKQHGTANDTSFQTISSPPSKTTGLTTRGSIPLNSFYIISDKVPVGGGIAGVVEELEGAPKVLFVGGGFDVSCLHSPVSEPLAFGVGSFDGLCSCSTPGPLSPFSSSKHSSLWSKPEPLGPSSYSSSSCSASRAARRVAWQGRVMLGQGPWDEWGPSIYYTGQDWSVKVWSHVHSIK